MANNWAIAVGINHYEFLPDASLQFADRDALEMRRFLLEKGGFESDKVLWCGNGADGSKTATRAVLRQILLHDLQRAENADNLWFFFSGHGEISETDKQDYLMTVDANPRDLEATAISIHFVTDRLRACRAKNIVLILDMCRNESQDGGRKSVESITASLRELVKVREGQQGIITLFSCARGQSSYEIAELKQGAFTYALLEGLQQCSILKDLEAYLGRRVPELHQSYPAAVKMRKQVPLIIPEPGWKYEEPILSNYATAADVSRLKDLALDAEHDDIHQATRLWIQVNLLATDYEDRRRSLNRILHLTRQPQAPIITPPNPVTNPTVESPPTPPGFPLLKVIQFTSVKLDSTGKIVDRPKHTAEIFIEDLGNGVSLTMVQIPAGEFLMGSPNTEEGRFDTESPQHKVKVPEFYIGQTLVTQAQWEKIMGNNPSHFTGDSKLPVEKVSWHDAREFCEKLSQRTQREYRLPSEAEWEYACRAGTNTPFCFGETVTGNLANYGSDNIYRQESKVKKRIQTIPVAQFPPNAFGLYDMHGNLWEWCLDTWHSNYQGVPTDGSPWIDRDCSSDHVVRGGSWFIDPRLCRSASRFNLDPGHRSLDVIGFRIVCEIPRTRNRFAKPT